MSGVQPKALRLSLAVAALFFALGLASNAARTDAWRFIRPLAWAIVSGRLAYQLARNNREGAA